MKKLLILIGLVLSFTMNAQISPNIQWQKALGGSNNDGAYSIQQTSDGGYIMAGVTLSNDGDVSGNHSSNDVWAVKLSSTGIIQWQKALGGLESDEAFTIQQTADEGYIIAGVTFSNDGDVSGNHGGADAWVVKLSATGEIQWQKALGGLESDRAFTIQQTADEGYIIAGLTGSIDGDGSGNQVSDDAWVVKLSSTGIIQWQKALGGLVNDQASTIQQTADGGYIMAGITGSNDGDVSGNHGSSDAWVVKLSSDQLSTTEFSNISLKLYPNPTYSLINIQTSNNVVLDKIIITDLMGKTVMEQTQNTNQVSVEKLATGVYILNAYSEGNKFQEKFIKK